MPRLHRFLPLVLVLLLAACASSGRPLAAQQEDSAATEHPLVLVVATGGTIAGVQNAPGTLGAYRAGTLSAEQNGEAVPELARFARVETEQFSNVPSPLITPAQWVDLSRLINRKLAERPEIAGVVVTHGTDRLEETAFFLYLTVRSPKPVIVVGSQRPATGISPDGPINLLAAVRTAVAPSAVGKGVLVVMDDRILSARDVRKHYQRVGGFAGGEMGMLGVVAGSGPTFFYAPTRRFGPDSEFDVLTIDSLPAVDLVFSYPGGTGPSYREPPAGVVVTTTGFTCAESFAFLQLARQGTTVVSVFPSGDNVNGVGGQTRDSLFTTATERCPDVASPEEWQGRSISPFSVQHLTPHKARILLMLALAHTRERSELRRIFSEY